MVGPDGGVRSLLCRHRRGPLVHRAGGRKGKHRKSQDHEETPRTGPGIAGRRSRARDAHSHANARDLGHARRDDAHNHHQRDRAGKGSQAIVPAGWRLLHHVAHSHCGSPGQHAVSQGRRWHARRTRRSRAPRLDRGLYSPDLHQPKTPGRVLHQGIHRQPREPLVGFCQDRQDAPGIAGSPPLSLPALPRSHQERAGTKRERSPRAGTPPGPVSLHEGHPGRHRRGRSHLHEGAQELDALSGMAGRWQKQGRQRRPLHRELRHVRL
mmetsp:Transcript_15828/g.43791  ORF Transcript_15828/g.43791 Transcript_15828/m.43791 type:complete len:267 (-) Transcript_15828:3989-4789(-)